MILWLPLAVAVSLVAATLRTWVDFTRHAERLRAEIEHARQLIESHTDELTTVREETLQLDAESGVLMQKRDQLERSVAERRAEVAKLEERLERARPRSRRVDMDPYEDGGSG